MSIGSQTLIEKIKTYKPKVAVFNGKGIYEVFSGQKTFPFGKQAEKIDGTDTVRSIFKDFGKTTCYAASSHLQYLVLFLNCNNAILFKYSVFRLIGSLWADTKSDNNNRMIQLTDVFCALFIYKGKQCLIIISS